MGHSVASAVRSQEVNSLDRVRPAMAKADVRSQSESIAMTGIVRDALMRHFGSLKAAALEMEIDQAQLHRQLESGTLNLARLAKCGDVFAGKFAALLAEHSAALVNPKARGFQLLREIDQRVAEIRQLLEHCA